MVPGNSTSPASVSAHETMNISPWGLVPQMGPLPSLQRRCAWVYGCHTSVCCSVPVALEEGEHDLLTQLGFCERYAVTSVGQDC